MTQKSGGPESSDVGVKTQLMSQGLQSDKTDTVVMPKVELHDDDSDDSIGSSCDRDEILSVIGRFGKFQLLLTMFVVIPQFLEGAIILSPSWTMYSAGERCRVPSIDGYTNRFSGGSVSNPNLTRYITQSQCSICWDQESNDATCSNRTGCLFGTVVRADKPLISGSFAAENDLGCENSWRKQLVWSLMNVGVLLANAVNGPLADRYGRRPVLMAATAGSILVTIVVVFIDKFWWYAGAVLVLGAITFALYTPPLIVFMESSGGPERTWMAILPTLAWTGGQLWLVGWAWVFRDRFWIQVFASLPVMLLLPVFWVFPESIRWLISQRRYKQAVACIKEAAALNGERPTDKEIEALLTSDLISECEPIKGQSHMEQCDDTSEQEPKRMTIFDMFKHWRSAKNTIVNFYLWFSASMAYYGLSQNTADLPSDPFLSFTLMCLIEVPAYIFGPWLTNGLGRRAALIITYCVAGIGCILAGLLTNTIVVMTMALLGKMCISASFVIVYVYAAELFPTVVRQSGTGFSSVCARVGSLSAPLVRILGDVVAPWVPIVVYGSIALSAGILTLALPETKNRALPETIEDAANMGVRFEVCLLMACKSEVMVGRTEQAQIQ